MKMTLHALDEEIRQVETRIALERIALEDAVSGCTNSLRNTVTSPKMLLALAGIGYTMGKLMFGRKAEAPPAVPQKVGVLGLLTGVAGAAISLMRPGLGGTLARWAAAKAFSRRKAAPTTSAPAARPRTPSAVR